MRQALETRLKAGISQIALAAKMDVNRTHVSATEGSQQNVTIRTLWHAVLALDVRPAALLEETAGDYGTCW